MDRMDQIESATVDVTITDGKSTLTESYVIEEKNVSQVRDLLGEFATRHRAALD